MSNYEYYEKRLMDPGIDVLGWKRAATGVLKGQLIKHYLETFDTEAEAEAKYGSMNWYNQYTAPSVSLNHLPGEEDYVPGGAYPDDW